MNNVELQEIWQQLLALPPEAQREVANVISLFQSRYQRSQAASQFSQQNLR